MNSGVLRGRSQLPPIERRALAGRIGRNSYGGGTSLFPIRPRRLLVASDIDGEIIGDGSELLEGGLQVLQNARREDSWRGQRVRILQVSEVHLCVDVAGWQLSLDEMPAIITRRRSKGLRLFPSDEPCAERDEPFNCDLVDAPRMRHHEMATLSEEQARAFLTATVGDRLEALFVLALATGMRQGELLALKWRDVDFSSGTLQVWATLQHTLAGYEFRKPKTAHSRRRIALSELAQEALRLHYTRQVEERRHADPGWQDLDLVFPTRIGGPKDGYNLLRQSFFPLLRRANLPCMRFHNLRHIAATLLLGRGINPKIVSEMLGHSHIAITLHLYSHVTSHMQQQAADAMDAALGDL
jgi:integrase